MHGRRPSCKRKTRAEGWEMEKEVGNGRCLRSQAEEEIDLRQFGVGAAA